MYIVKVNRLMERVEHAFIKHFANGNHRKGMSTLRPTAKRERHRITFLLGMVMKKLLFILNNVANSKVHSYYGEY